MITIEQNNYDGTSNLMPIQSPLTFVLNVNTAGDPNDVFCDIVDSDLAEDVLATFKCIFTKSLDSENHEFIFTADSVVRSVMMLGDLFKGQGFSPVDFEDFYHAENAVIEVENITSNLKLRFYDDSSEVFVDCVFAHAARQFGQAPNMKDIYDNDEDFYLCPDGQFCYLYFYNNNPNATNISIYQKPDEVVALDYDSVEFSDFDNQLYTIEIEPE